MFVCRYYLILEKNGKMKYVPFKSGTGLNDKATLEQIDYVTSQYKNQEEFLMYLKSNGILTEAPDKVYIGYKHSKQLMKKDVIYDSPIITFASLSSLRHKRQNVKNALIDKNQNIINFIKRIKSYAIVQKSFDSIKRSKLFPFHVRQALEEYLKISSKNYKSPTEQFDLKEIDETIIYRILKDYSEFRNLVLWEKRYLEKLESQKEKAPEEYTQMNLVDYFEMKATNPETILETKTYDESEIVEKTISERSFDSEKGPEEMIENSILKECYIKCDGDIELIVGILGEDYLEDLSEEDQYRCGYTDFKQRQR